VPQNGFSGSVSVTTSGLPTGVTATPSPLAVSAGSPGTLTFSASSAATFQQAAVSISGTSGSLSANVTLQVSVTAKPVADPFIALGGNTAHGFYDVSRQLLFVTNPGLNELDVISGTDMSIKARIHVPAPWGIDQMADGKTLVLGSQAQAIVTVDENTYAVVQYPYSDPTQPHGIVFPNVVTLANGKVLMIGSIIGVDSNSIYDGGQFLYAWDSTANTFAKVEPTTPIANWEVDHLARSGDHKFAVFAADKFYVYSSDADSMTPTPLSTVNPTNDDYISGYAVNQDGSQIAVVTDYHANFFNGSLALLGSTVIPGPFQLDRTTVGFTPDGTKLLVQYNSPVAVEELDASSYAALGYVYADVTPDYDNNPSMVGVDANGNAYTTIDEGVRTVSLNQGLNPSPSNGNFAAPQCPVPVTAIPLNAATQIELSGADPYVNYYVGGQPATVSSDGTQITAPASSTAGPVDVECVDKYGNVNVALDAISYGVKPIGVSATLVSPSGTPLAAVYGFGFDPSVTETPTIAVGGTSAAITDNTAGPIALQESTFQVPNGSAGTSANVVVTSAVGTGTLSSGVTYSPKPTILQESGLLQLLFDTHRDVLYALKANAVDVLDASTLQWKTPLTLPSSGPAVAYDTMALSPDGSKLVLEGPSGSNYQFTVLDPDNVAAPAVLTYTPGITSSLSGSMAITEYNKALVTGFPPVEVDLSALTLKTVGVETGQVLRASPDGTLLCGADVESSGGAVHIIDPLTYATTTATYVSVFWGDMAVSPDDAHCAAIDVQGDSIGDGVGYFNTSAQWLNGNVGPEISEADSPGGIGGAYSPGGKVLVIPLEDSIEVWDTATGTLRARYMTPELLQGILGPENTVSPTMALDATGQTIFAISASGLTIMPLPVPLDQVPATTWPFGNHVGAKRAGATPGLAGLIRGRGPRATVAPKLEPTTISRRPLQ
jgi:hypothetical protein